MKRIHVILLVGMMSAVLLPSVTLAEREDFETDSLLSTLDKKLQLAKEDLSQTRTVLEKRSQKFLKLIDKEVEEGFVKLEAFTKDLNVQVEGFREDLNKVLSQENIQELKDYFENLDQQVIDSIHDGLIARIADRLVMTAEQVEELEPVFREDLQKRHELLKHSLAQKDFRSDEYEQKSEELWQDTLAELEGKLTPEQIQKLQAWRNDLQQAIRRVFSEKKE